MGCETMHLLAAEPTGGLGMQGLPKSRKLEGNWLEIR